MHNFVERRASLGSFNDDEDTNRNHEDGVIHLQGKESDDEMHQASSE